MSDDEKQTHHSGVLDGRSEREAAAKATLDNMARLRALRLEREANQPKVETSAPRKKKSATGSTATGRSKTTGSVKKEAKPQALSDWLETQVSVGRRT